MKQVLLYLLYWSYIRLSASFPVEEKPGFTTWPLEKRVRNPISAADFSSWKQIPLGKEASAQFGIPDPSCRGKIPEPAGDCWTMDKVTVDKMVEARKPEENNCKLKCLFYTSDLSGVAERTANAGFLSFLLKGAEEDREYQTIWDLHDRKYYPNKDDLSHTPETSCLYRDSEPRDMDLKYNGCQRSYFMAMSKAMAAECKDEEVYLMTTTKLNTGARVPENGIWWQVEFPTLIDTKRRPPEKQIKKIWYLQVDPITPEKLKSLRELPLIDQKPPEIKFRGEYWPKGPGEYHRLGLPPGKPTLEPEQKRSPSTTGLVERAGDEEAKICDDKDGDKGCYPYPYSLDKMYDFYNDVGW